ncbi:MAG: glycosyltransferase family 2 protein [Chthoniobacteraceae bacterium]
MLAQAIYHWIIVGSLLLILANIFANFRAFDGLRPAEPPENPPLVSILVPARNEERSIEACAGSLLRQEYPNCEVIVLDDHSDDGTGAIVERLFANAKNRRPNLTLRLLRGEPLPAGWTGKNWACHQLSQAARGEFLFFTDADTEHAPGTVTAAVAYAQRNRAGLVSAWPRLLTVTPGEKLIVPVIVLIGFAFCPFWLQRWIQKKPERADGHDVRGMGVANGQFMFFSRRAYVRIGGHEAVRAHVVEDVTLGRQIAALMPEGERLFNCDALQFSTVRMYRSFAETWEGFTKNVRAAFDDRGVMFWLFGGAQAAVFFWPFIAIFLVPASLRRVVGLQIAIIFLIRFLLAARFRTSRFGALLHPVGVLLMMLIGLNSWRLSKGRGVVWKGRIYRPEI